MKKEEIKEAAEKAYKKAQKNGYITFLNDASLFKLGWDAAVEYFTKEERPKMTITDSLNYNIAIRNDGKEFRIPKGMDYGEKLPRDKFVIQYGDKPCLLQDKYFDKSGYLLLRWGTLDRIM